MLPFLAGLSPNTPGSAYQLEMFEFEDLRPNTYPSITIQSLCGYDYTPEKYREEARKLESLGLPMPAQQARARTACFGNCGTSPVFGRPKARLKACHRMA